MNTLHHYDNPLDDSIRKIVSAVLDEYMRIHDGTSKVQRNLSGSLLQIKSNEIYILEGNDPVEIYAQNGRLLFITTSTLIIGAISTFGYPSTPNSLKFFNSRSFYRMKSEDFLTLIDKANLWQHLCQVLCHYIHRLSSEHITTQQNSCTEVVQNLIHEYYVLPTSVHEKLSLMNFIKSRSHISKSNIYNILNKLSKEDFFIF